jgi:GWxTD domain-containing protein
LLILAVPVSVSQTPAEETSPPEIEDELRGLIISYPDSAELCAQLALVNFSKNTPRGRALGIKYMKQALKIEPMNSDYHLILAEMYFRGDYWSNGVTGLRDLLEIDPGHDLGHGRLARAYLDRAKEEWLEPWFVGAAGEFAKVGKTCPLYTEARKQLALCYFDLSQPDSALVVLTGLSSDSLDVDALLLLGMSYCDMDDMARADSAFSEALARMNEHDRTRYTSIEYIATPEELMLLAAANPDGRQAVSQQLWKKRDPNPGTLVNERFIEHLFRVAFSDLHFSAPKAAARGSETARGEIYIRYGQPLSWFYDPFGDGVTANEAMKRFRGGSDLSHNYPLLGDGSSIADVSWYHRNRPLPRGKRRWKWNYSDFTVDFEDRFFNGNFAFPFEADWAGYAFARIKKEVPEIYELRIKDRMRVVLDALNFAKADGTPYLKVVFGCDTRGVEYIQGEDLPRGTFDIEIAVLDTSRADIEREKLTLDLVADSSAIGQSQFPLIGTWITEAPPGDALTAISMKSQANEAVGFTSKEISVRGPRQFLQLSNIELRFAEDGPPNPSHVYLKKGEAYIAFSVYNVSTAADGTGDLEIGYKLSRQIPERGVLEGFLETLTGGADPDLSGELTYVWSKYQMKTPGRMVDQVIGVDLGPLSAGDYLVVLMVVDKLSGQATSATTWLRIVSDLEM